MSYRHIALRAPLGFLVLVGVGLLGQPQAATAADLGYDYSQSPQIQQQMVTFGSGWYVRGDLGGTEYPGIGTTPPLLGSAANITLSDTKKQLGYTASLGGGYAFTNSVRVDALFDFHQPLHSDVGGASFACQNGYGLNPGTALIPASSYPTYETCTGHSDARLNSYDVMANVYYDLGTWYGITPYVGAGAGLSFGHYSTAATYTQSDQTPYNLVLTDPVSGSSYHFDYDRTASGTYYNFAWALMAGFSYDIYNHLKLDIGYRYLNLGTVLGSKYTVQEARAGLRYMIDN